MTNSFKLKSISIVMLFFLTACGGENAVVEENVEEVENNTVDLEVEEESPLESIEDVQLKQAIEDQNDGDSDDMTLTELDLSSYEIHSIEGIELLSSLNDLNLANNEITDYEPLLSLPSLERVELGEIALTFDLEDPKWDVFDELEVREVETSASLYLDFPEHSGPSEGVFYTIEENGRTVHLMGSIHVGYEELYPLQEGIEEAFQASDYLAVEVDINDIDQIAMSQLLLREGMYTDGTRLTDHIDEALLSEIVEILAPLGMNEQIINQFKPWVISLLLSDAALMNTDYSSDTGIDLYFLEQASERELPIISLETAESQFQSLSSGPEEEQVEELEALLSDENILSNYSHDLSQLMRLWQSGRTDVFSLLRDMESGHSATSLDERDLAMVDQIEGFLSGTWQEGDHIGSISGADEDVVGSSDDETFFVVVGAMHLVGETSIAGLLSERGYELK